MNYRSGRAEDDFTGNISTVITPTKAHNPRVTTLALDAIKKYGLACCEYSMERLKVKLPPRFVCESCSYQHVDSTWVTKSTLTSRECYGEEGLGY
ncbi:MAG: hypothetical protein M3Y53_06790 [Thermoproteota archaeon]|nr:hypothetical protein [Thermoproteota archaeon]